MSLQQDKLELLSLRNMHYNNLRYFTQTIELFPFDTKKLEESLLHEIAICDHRLNNISILIRREQNAD